MEFTFKLHRNSRHWLVTHIRCLNLSYHCVPFNRQNPQFYPDWFGPMLAYHVQHEVRSNRDRSTFTAVLRGDQIRYFFKNNKLYVGDIELSMYDDRRQETRAQRLREDQARRIKQLTFNHDYDNAFKFKAKYKDVFTGVSEKSAKLFLLHFVKPQDLAHFEELLPDSDLEKMLNEFIIYYNVEDNDHLRLLKETPLTQGLENFVNRRMRYQQELHPVLPFKFRLRQFIKDLPEDLKQFFEPNELPDLVLNTNLRIIQHLRFKLKEAELRGQQNEEQLADDSMQVDPLAQLANELNRPSY